MNIYNVWCDACDYNNEFLVKANTSKEAVDKVYKHYKDVGVAGFRGLDECGYRAIPKKMIKAIDVEKFLKDVDIQSISD